MFPKEGGIKYKKVILVTCSFNPWRFKSHLLLPLIASTVWLYWPYWVICHSVLKVPVRCSNIKSSTTTNTRGIFWPQPNCLPPPFSSLPSFSCFATSLLTYFPSACLQHPWEPLSHSHIPPEMQGETKWPSTTNAQTHTRRRLSSIHCCLCPKKGFLTGDDSAVACSHSVPVSPSHTHFHTCINMSIFSLAT